MTDIRVCQIGFGSIGKRHYKNLLELGMEYAALADPLLPNMNVWQNYRNPRKCLGEHAKDNIVVIASPTEFHLEQLDMADHYGAKAIFLEKPPHYNSLELQEFMDTHSTNSAKNKVLRCAVGFNYRFHPAIRQLKSKMSAGPTARLIMMAYDDVENWPTWSEDSWLNSEYGGALLTSASHSVDTALYLMGPVDSLECELAYKNGVVWGVHLIMYHVNESLTGIVIRWGGPKNSTLVYSEEKILSSYNMQRDGDNMHLDCMKAFLDFVEDKPSEICTLEQSLEVMKILDMARESNGAIKEL